MLDNMKDWFRNDGSRDGSKSEWPRSLEISEKRAITVERIRELDTVVGEEDLAVLPEFHPVPAEPRDGDGEDSTEEAAAADEAVTAEETATAEAEAAAPDTAGNGQPEATNGGPTADGGNGRKKPEGPPLAADMETKEMLKAIKKERKRRSERAMAEAQELEELAKQKKREAKAEKKLRTNYAEHMEMLAEVAPHLGLDPDRPVTEIPELADHMMEVDFQTVKEDRSYIRVCYDSEENRHFYEVIEPRLTESEEEVYEFLRDTLIQTVEDGPDGGEWQPYLVDEIEKAIVNYSILVDRVSKQRIQYHLLRDFLGYGPIDVLMQDPMIEDISCDGPGIPVFLYHREHESVRTNITFEDEEELNSYVIRLAQRSGKHISVAEPLLDATLPDTSRLQATLSREVTARGPSFTIRKFRADPLTPPDLVRLGTMDPKLAAFYWLGMEQGSSLIYAGGTASGKTTTLNAVSSFIPPERKIVTIEDTREINLPHDNWIASVTRNGFGGEAQGEKAGEVDMYDLLEAALRQRPEYLLVGEVRGAEAQTLFQAMATGHATYSTLHANSAESAIYRLENPPINVPRPMLQSLDAVSIQTQARVDGRIVRRIKEVTEVVGIDPKTDEIEKHPVFRWDSAEDRYEFLGDSHVLDKIREKNNWTPQEMEREWLDRAFVIEWMVEKGIRQIDDVADVISAYYRGQDDILERARDALRVETVDSGEVLVA